MEGMTDQQSSSSSAPRAVLFDIDGTLVDSNYAHVDAWVKAFRDVGHPVQAWRIHRSIGKDASLLVEGLLGEELAGQLTDQVKEAHTAHYADHLGEGTDLHVLEGATELLAELSRRGRQVVLATSAPEEELAFLRELLDVEGALWAVTSSEDVETAKPDPGIVEVALREAGVPPEQAIMVGDATWDVEAAARAGVASVGVLTGGFSRDELVQAGAETVYDDVAALLADLDGSPLGG